MITEIWNKWEPTTRLARKYYVESISDGVDNFFILLSGMYGKSEIKLLFADTVHAYRVTYETFRVQLLEDIQVAQGEPVYGDATFFLVHNSRYIQWLKTESDGLLTKQEGQKLIHFGIMGVEFIVDIVATQKPKLEFL